MTERRTKLKLLTPLLAALLLSGCAFLSDPRTDAEREVRQEALATQAAAERAASQASLTAPSSPTSDEPKKSLDEKPPRKIWNTVPLAVLPLSDAPSMTLEEEIRVRFHDKAVAQGAPASVPRLRAMVIVDKTIISAVFSAMGLTVWRIHATADGISEWRHPKLDEHVSAEKFLRDFTFALWPEESVNAHLPEGLRFVTGASGDESTQTRAIEGEDNLLLKSTTTRRNGRAISTISNYPEGYTLTIESID